MIHGGPVNERFRQRVLQALYREAPEQNKQLKVRALGESEEIPIRYYVYADVLKELLKAARFREDSATALLLGQFAIDEGGPFVEISAFQDLRYLYGGDLVELTRPGVREFFRSSLEGGGYPGAHIVGVFASRPGSDAALDEEVARLHLSLFNLPFQAALIMDAQSERLGIYTRAIGQPFFNAPFFVVEQAESGPEEEPEREDEDVQELENEQFLLDDGRKE